MHVARGSAVLERSKAGVSARRVSEAERTGDEYDKLLAEGVRYAAKEDYRKAAKAYREAVTLKPDEPTAYHNLGVALDNSGHEMEAAQRYLEARERWPEASKGWAEASASAFDQLKRRECAEVTKPACGTTKTSSRCSRVLADCTSRGPSAGTGTRPSHPCGTARACHDRAEA